MFETYYAVICVKSPTQNIATDLANILINNLGNSKNRIMPSTIYYPFKQTLDFGIQYFQNYGPDPKNNYTIYYYYTNNLALDTIAHMELLTIIFRNRFDINNINISYEKFKYFQNCQHAIMIKISYTNNKLNIRDYIKNIISKQISQEEFDYAQEQYTKRLSADYNIIDEFEILAESIMDPTYILIRPNRLINIIMDLKIVDLIKMHKYINTRAIESLEIIQQH